MSKFSWLVLFAPVTAGAIGVGAHVSGGHSSAHVSSHVSSAHEAVVGEHPVATRPFVISGAHRAVHANNTYSTVAHEPSYWYYLSKCLQQNKNEECER